MRAPCRVGSAGVRCTRATLGDERRPSNAVVACVATVCNALARRDRAHLQKTEQERRKTPMHDDYEDDDDAGIGVLLSQTKKHGKK